MGVGIGAWLGPVGGYGASGNHRRNYWNGRGGMQLSNAEYYKYFVSCCTDMINKYDFRFFKFDGISAQGTAFGPDKGDTGIENAEGIISIERDVRMAPGDSAEVDQYRFVFRGVETHKGPNYSAMRGTMDVYRGDQQVAVMHPEKRFYFVQRNTMTEAAIDAGLFRDLYVAMGEQLDGDAWAVRLYHKPFIRWIWLGALFMTAGGLLAASDRRYRIKVKEDKTAMAGGHTQ